MDALKDMFNKAFYEHLATEINKIHKPFHTGNFVKDVIKNMEDLSLNQRMRNTSKNLKKHLPEDYGQSIEIMKKVIPQLKRGYTTLVFPDFVGQYGLDHIHISLEALAFFTRYGSSEFAIREFLKKDFKTTIQVMEKWAGNKNEHIRRLASEGSRPRLPWSFKLDEVIKNPAATKNILEKLKSDDTLYVKKSVANHLNDFSKDHPDYMLDLVGSWNLENPHTSWIVKHACRSLIKKGDQRSLQLFDFSKNVKIEVLNFTLGKSVLKLGDTLEFAFDMASTSKSAQKLAVDYAIHYVKKSSGLSPKVFKLKEVRLGPSESIHISKKQILKDFTTRKHYGGMHVLEIMVNGHIFVKHKFELKI